MHAIVQNLVYIRVYLSGPLMDEFRSWLHVQRLHPAVFWRWTETEHYAFWTAEQATQVTSWLLDHAVGLQGSISTAE